MSHPHHRQCLILGTHRQCNHGLDGPFQRLGIGQCPGPGQVLYDQRRIQVPSRNSQRAVQGPQPLARFAPAHRHLGIAAHRQEDDASYPRPGRPERTFEDERDPLGQL